MRRFGAQSVSILCLLIVSADLALASVRYTVSLINPDRHLVQVTMEIPAGSAEHELQLPVWNALYQVRDFSQYMNWIRAQSSDGKPLALIQLNKSRWRIADAKNGARIEYEMFSDDPGPYGAAFTRQHAFFNLAEILVYADDFRDQPAQIEFHNLPAQWKVAVPLPEHNGIYTAENYDRLVDSPVELSNFAEQDFTGKCGNYRVIVDPNLPERVQNAARILDTIVPSIHRIVDAATVWMDDCPFQTYAFIYHFSDDPGGGMEHSYSTAITVPANYATGSLDRFESVTAHEFFHLWNVKRIRPQSLEPVDYTKENYTPALWFSEGVDSTASNYIWLRAGLLDEPGYLRHLSLQINELQSRPAHLTQSVEQSSEDAWLEKYPYYALPDRSISYYNKGELLGVLLDLEMRKATDDRASLRDLFRWMNQHYAKQGKFFADSEAIRDGAQELSHADLREFFQHYVSGVAEIPWDTFFARVGLRVTATEVPVANPGFQAAEEFNHPIAVVTVDPGSAAATAGLQEGDIILQINGEPAGRDFARVIQNLNPGSTLRLTIRRDGVQHDLEWILASRKQTVFQVQDVPKVSPEQRAHRAAWLFDRAENSAGQK